MNPAQQKALLQSCLAPTRDRRPQLGGEEARVPVSVYLDPARFEAERALHRRSLNLVAHTSELAERGSFVTLTVAGAPVLVVRGDEGGVRAFLNVCRHRGATVERRERGMCKRFVCPYHAWSYDTQGTLAKVRHREGFPSAGAEDLSLTPLACEAYGPFVWVCPTPGLAPTLDSDARHLVDEIDGLGLGGLEVYAREQRVWRANWKILVEGGLESYHFKVAHRNTIGSLFADTTSTFEEHGDHMRSVLPRTSIASLGADDASGSRDGDWALLRHANVVYTLSPNASVLAQQGHFALILMAPVGMDETRIDVLTVGRPVPPGAGGERVRAFLERNHRFTLETLSEDFVLAEEIQRGLGTGANEVLRFGRFEDALAAWHRRLDARLGDC